MEFKDSITFVDTEQKLVGGSFKKKDIYPEKKNLFIEVQDEHGLFSGFQENSEL